MTANVQAAEINPIATFSWLIVPHSSFIASFCKKKLKKEKIFDTHKICAFDPLPRWHSRT
tara:strand:- start:253 stop:432 length:180 start_codon:yes stop_codon:yes gene_type:complete